MGLRCTELRYLAIAPTLGAMDISLSFSTTMKSRPDAPALFNPSYDNPDVSAPSPSTDTTLNDSPDISRPTAIPKPAEIAVAACPAPKASYGLSERLRKPDMPFSVRSVSKPLARPVRSLCG